MTDAEIKELNVKYEKLLESIVQEFYSADITRSGRPLVTWLNFFDFVVISILMNKHDKINKQIDTDVYRMAAELFILGNKDMNILHDRQARNLIDSVILDKPVDHVSYFQLLIWLARTDDTNLKIGLLYMLPLLTLVNSKRYPNYIHRSNIITVLTYQLIMSKYNKDHKFDIITDAQKAFLKIKRILTNIESDKSFDQDEYVEYTLDTFRMFNVCFFGALFSRDITFREFKPLAIDVLNQRLAEHKSVLDNHIVQPKS